MQHASSVATTATKAAYSSSGGLAFLSLFTLNDWALISAMVIGAATFLTNLIFKVRDDRRKSRADKRAAEAHRVSGMNKEAAEVSSTDIDAV